MRQDELDQLHDRAIDAITIRIGRSGEATLTVGVSGSMGPDGVRLARQELVATQLLACTLHMSAWEAAPDSIDIVEVGIAPDVTQRVREWVDAGFKAPRELLSVRFHSGSSLSIACASVALRSEVPASGSPDSS